MAGLGDASPEVARHASAGDGTRVVPLGRVWIHGHFTGIATTSTHCLEVSIPLQHELPISAILPVIAAFQEASETEFEGSTREHAMADAKADATADAKAGAEADATPAHHKPTRLSKESWLKLIGILAAADRPESAVGGASAAAAPASSAFSPRVHDFHRQVSEVALEVDYEAKESLLREVMQERNQLRSRNEELEEELHRGPLSRFVTKSSRFLAEVMRLDNAGNGEGARTLSKGSSRIGRKHSAGGRTASKPTPRSAVGHQPSAGTTETGSDCGASPRSMMLGEDEQYQGEDDPRLRVEGHFTGHVRTRKHLLDVNMPVRAYFSGHTILEVLQDLGGPACFTAPSEGAFGMPSAQHKHLTTPEIYQRLHRLLSPEIPKQIKARGDSESKSPGNMNNHPSSPEAVHGHLHPPVRHVTSPVSPTWHPVEGSRMILVDRFKLEQKLQELEQLAVRLTSLQ